MENIVRNVRDIDAVDRNALEHVVGRQLHDNQRLIIQLSEIDASGASEPAETGHRQKLEDWTRIYEGLGDEEIEEIDKIVKTRANLTRNLP